MHSLVIFVDAVATAYIHAAVVISFFEKLYVAVCAALECGK